MSVFHGEDTVPPHELRIDCKFQCQAVAKRAICSILSANCTTFTAQLAHRRIFSLPLPTAASRQSYNASHSHSTSHPYTSCPDSPYTVSTCRRVYPGAVVSSTSLQVPSLRRPTAYSLSMAVSNLLSRRRISGNGCCRSAVPAVSDS